MQVDVVTTRHLNIVKVSKPNAVKTLERACGLPFLTLTRAIMLPYVMKAKRCLQKQPT